MSDGQNENDKKEEGTSSFMIESTRSFEVPSITKLLNRKALKSKGTEATPTAPTPPSTHALESRKPQVKTAPPIATTGSIEVTGKTSVKVARRKITRIDTMTLDRLQKMKDPFAPFAAELLRLDPNLSVCGFKLNADQSYTAIWQLNASAQQSLWTGLRWTPQLLSQVLGQVRASRGLELSATSHALICNSLGVKPGQKLTLAVFDNMLLACVSQKTIQPILANRSAPAKAA